MSLLLNDIHLPLLIKSTLSEHNILPWNNLDQLSSLWAVFTKYKNNMRDGFRLENLSWRLWYRQSVLQKKEKPKTSGDMNYSTMLVRPLRRTRSLPILSQWHQNVLQKKTTKLVPSKQPLPSELPQQRKKQKFFITEETQEPKKEDQLLFKKANSLIPKPVSLLSEMLQQPEKTSSSGLRRCQSRYCRLDQFFLNAA